VSSHADQRIDPYLGTVVHVVGARQARPNLPSTGCPFCVGGLEAPDPYEVHWFPNRWPAMQGNRCEVVLYTPHHDATLPSLGVPGVRKVIDLWADRTTALGRRDDVDFVLVFENRGPQVGATIAHRVMTRLFMDRGVRLDRTYQLNFGGNTDFLNMLERERLESKKISKTNAVTSMLDYELDSDDVHVGPSDHVPWLQDRKWCYIRMEGTTFGDVPLNAELKLEVWDSPNSAGVITDAIRCLKLGLDRGLKGTLVAPSAYFMKSPPRQISDDVARERVEAFIRGDDNETLVGTEKAPARTLRTLAASRSRTAATAGS